LLHLVERSDRSVLPAAAANGGGDVGCGGVGGGRVPGVVLAPVSGAERPAGVAGAGQPAVPEDPAPVPLRPERLQARSSRRGRR
jgi:hypothetical protein